jgi:hypothetical protein
MTPKRGPPPCSRNLCSKPKAIRGIKIRCTEQILTSIISAETNNHHHNSTDLNSYTPTDRTGSNSNTTTTVSQSTINHSNSMAAWYNTPSREQHSDSTFPLSQNKANDTVTITQSNNDSNTIITNIRTPKLYSCDPNVTNNYIRNHLNNINQNTISTAIFV